MVCIYCKGKTDVTNSRSQKRLNQTWRRRACRVCGTVFTTIEASDLTGSIVVKKPEGHEPFSRDTLFLSLVRSLGHRTNAVDDASALCATVIGLLLGRHPGALVEAADIAKLSHAVLRQFDQAAATHYAAYHARLL